MIEYPAKQNESEMRTLMKPTLHTKLIFNVYRKDY